MEYICPHCGEEISHVDYETEGYSYGSYFLEPDHSGYYEREGSEDSGETNFTCPECGENIDSPDDLEEAAVVEEEEEEEEIAPIRIPQEDNKMIVDYVKRWRPESICKECTKCGQVVEFDHEEEEIGCPICETIIKKS